jgi:hypothetical protein
LNKLDHLHARHFLANCSSISLDNFLLAKQNRAANLERDIAERVQELLENLVLIELAFLLRGRVPFDPRLNVSPPKVAQGAYKMALSPKLIPPDGWRWIWERSDIRLSRKAILQCLKKFSHATLWGSLTRRQLMQMTGLSRATVTRCMSDLRAKKFVETE